jgi:protease PrsW
MSRPRMKRQLGTWDGNSPVASRDPDRGLIPRRVPPLSWIVVLVIGVGLFELLRHALIDTGNPNLLPALILVGAAVVPAAFTAFVYGRRLPFAVTGGLLAATAVLGGVIGIVVAGTLEYDTLRRLGTLPMLAVGLIEETAKLLVPAVILLVMVSRHRLNAVDGLLIGVASGAGFAALETMGYAFVQLIATKGSLSAVDGVLLLRGLLSPAAHMAWTGLVAAALWAAAAARWSGASIARLVAAFVVAVGLHTAWDSIGTTLGYALLAAIGLAALGFAAHRLGQRFPPGEAASP